MLTKAVIQVFVLLLLFAKGNYSQIKPDRDITRTTIVIADEDNRDYYSEIVVVNGKKGQKLQTFQKGFNRRKIKTDDRKEGKYNMNKETKLESDEIELRDVEYRLQLAEIHGSDPNKLWISESLEECMNDYPGFHIRKGKHQHHRGKRLAISNADRYWSKATIPYTWSKDFDGVSVDTKNGILRAFHHIEYWTCIRFVEWNNQTNIKHGLNHDNRLKFIRSEGCSSFIGRTDDSEGQKINCCKDRACLHELCHSMGMFHEQRSPLHQDFIRINHANIDTKGIDYLNFREISPKLVKLYGRYDLSSVMHYGVFFGHNDYQDPITVLDSDDELILLNGDPTDFYLFEVLCDIMECAALKCSDFQLPCQNWGYTTVIRYRCQCRCIDGLDPHSGCTSLYRTDLTKVEKWPADGFTLLKPETGCPNGFLEGQIQFTTRYTSQSRTNNALMSHDGKTWNQSFCTKKSVSALLNKNAWGPGRYCIYQNGGKCPKGFESGSVLIDTNGGPITRGEQPDGEFSTDVKWDFCCRLDGKRKSPLRLPNKEPVILFQQSRFGCQTVDGMVSKRQYFRVKNMDKNVAYRKGKLPRVKQSYKNFYFYFCYYTPIDYVSAKTYSRWPEEPFAMIKSKDGCPKGFTSSYITQITEPLSVSEILNSDITINSNEITYKFCSKQSSEPLGPEAKWQYGSYCILRQQGKCPTGFLHGVVNFDDSGKMRKNGTVPDGEYAEDMHLDFCCREDGMWSDPISFPTTDSFVLFRHKDFPCQKVVDMVEHEEFINVKNAATRKQSISGFVPRVTTVGQRYQIHFCHYFHLQFDCGDIYDLSGTSPTVDISSPNFPAPYLQRKKCNYIFKGPKDSKLTLKFHSFDVEATDTGECVSTVGIRSDLPGQPEIKYCGDKFENTILSLQNFLSVSFTSSNNDQKLTGFSATVTLIRDSDLCYTNNGTTYNGKVNATKKMQSCLPWNKVAHCERNLYGRSDSASWLNKNYCRKAGDGIAPWCYTDADQCLRDYCDVCNLGTCYNIFLDCDEVIQENPKFCMEDEEAPRGCRKKCGFCDNSVPKSVSKVRCTSPLPLLDSAPTTFLQTYYNVGETVVYKCMTGNEEEFHTCLSDGSWSGGNFVCGRCPSGWIAFSNSCYKWFDVYMTVDEGKELCQIYNAVMTTAKNENEDKFLLSLRDNSRSFWLGIEKQNGKHVWNEDNAPVTWTNWANAEDAFFSCANVKENGKWNGWGCKWDYLSIICKFTPSKRIDCLDYRNDCEELLKDDPRLCISYTEFAENTCPRTCGFCGRVKTCDKPNTPLNAIQIIGSSLDVQQGMYFGYKCKDGYEKLDGDDKRACLRDGTLTGKPIVCARRKFVPSRNNDVSLRSRKVLADERKIFIGDNEAMRVHKTGNVVAWMFYSVVDCEVTFSVWRYVSAKRFKLIGRNTITRTRHDRKRKVKITELEQIKVQKNDIIGIYFAYGRGSCIPYDLCRLNQAIYGNQMESVYKKTRATKWNINNTYDFKTLSDNSRCKIWSFSAVVQ